MMHTKNVPETLDLELTRLEPGDIDIDIDLFQLPYILSVSFIDGACAV